MQPEYSLYRTVVQVKPGEVRTSFKGATKSEHMGTWLSMDDNEAMRYAVGLVSFKLRLKLSYPSTGREAFAILKRHGFRLMRSVKGVDKYIV